MQFEDAQMRALPGSPEKSAPEGTTTGRAPFRMRAALPAESIPQGLKGRRNGTTKNPAR